jgi:hypothetical protein
MGHKNIIEINGKRYDAVSGKLLDQPSPAHPSKSSKAAPKHLDIQRPPKLSAHGVHTKTTKAQTLMRTAVKRPVHSAPVTPAKEPAIHHYPALDSKRLARAGKFSKSRLVSRFGNPSPSEPAIITAPLEVKHPPTHHEPTNPAHTPSASPAHHSSFNKALENAQSHRQPHPKHPNPVSHRVARRLHLTPHALHIASSGLAVLLLVGFIGLQNVPNLSMRLASARAGVNGSLPGYHPSGFAMNGPVQYRAGQITLSYKSTSDDRTFSVSQSRTDWNNEALIKNFVTINDRPYQAYQQDGRTIYIYDDSNATWLDHGIWYQVSGNANLSSDQLIRLANSI